MMDLELNPKQFLMMLENKEVQRKIRQLLKTNHGSKSLAAKAAVPVLNPTGLRASNEDVEILRLVFKWKILPLSTIRYYLAPNEKPKTYDKRVERLIHKGLLQRVNHIGLLRLVQLSSAGFLRLQTEFDGFKEEGFASENLWHDFLSMTLQFGLWAGAKPKDVDLVTEQEMRRFHRQDLPSWLPAINFHRPDGITRFKIENRNCLVSYETELSQKQLDRYESVAKYYAGEDDYKHVIWLVKNQRMVDSISKKLTEADASVAGKHNFILFDDYKTKFWDSEFVCGQKRGQTLGNLMSECSRAPVVELSQACRNTVVSDFVEKIANGLNY